MSNLILVLSRQRGLDDLLLSRRQRLEGHVILGAEPRLLGRLVEVDTESMEVAYKLPDMAAGFAEEDLAELVESGNIFPISVLVAVGHPLVFLAFTHLDSELRGGNISDFREKSGGLNAAHGLVHVGVVQQSLVGRRVGVLRGHQLRAAFGSDLGNLALFHGLSSC